MRYVIEGEWSGYVSRQRHVVHRCVTTRRDIAEWAGKVHAIRFTDGTSLYVSARECKPREKVKEILGYGSLLDDCRYYKVNSVSAVIDAEKAKKCADAFKPLADVAGKNLGVSL